MDAWMRGNGSGDNSAMDDDDEEEEGEGVVIEEEREVGVVMVEGLVISSMSDLFSGDDFGRDTERQDSWPGGTRDDLRNNPNHGMLSSQVATDLRGQ